VSKVRDPKPVWRRCLELPIDMILWTRRRLVQKDRHRCAEGCRLLLRHRFRLCDDPAGLTSAARLRSLWGNAHPRSLHSCALAPAIAINGIDTALDWLTQYRDSLAVMPAPSIMTTREVANEVLLKPQKNGSHR